jgi:formylglycine-generating enzyme required for sulfatase activity
MILIENSASGNYYLGKSEVTQRFWKSVMGSNPSFALGDNLPVERVSWNEVQQFLQKINQKTGMNFRLPTSSEWEFAALGGNTAFRYSGSNMISEVGWYEATSGSKTHPVMQLRPNGFGLYDMSGNVWEWCSDHSLKGGSWISVSSMCTIVNIGNPNDQGDYTIGFRICRSAE